MSLPSVRLSQLQHSEAFGLSCLRLWAQHILLIPVSSSVSECLSFGFMSRSGCLFGRSPGVKPTNNYRPNGRYQPPAVFHKLFLLLFACRSFARARKIHTASEEETSASTKNLNVNTRRAAGEHRLSFLNLSLTDWRTDEEYVPCQR